MSGSGHVEVSGLRVDPALHDFVTDELRTGVGRHRRPGSGTGWPSSCGRSRPGIASVLAVRDRLQAQIDEWHRSHRAGSHDPAAYRAFLESIGYLVPSGEPFEIDTADVDPEIADARRAAARRAVDERPLRAQRRQRAVGLAVRRALRHRRDGRPARARSVRPGPRRPRRRLGRAASSTTSCRSSDGSHADVVRYSRRRGRVDARRRARRRIAAPACVTPPRSPATGARRTTRPRCSSSTTGSAIELVIDRAHPSARPTRAGVADVVLESAVTTIVDLEDSVATVDGPDKVGAYRNWLGLMKGDLDRGGHQGRPHVRAHAWPTTARTRGRDGERSSEAGSGAAAGPQRRPPDDHAGRARRRRPAGAGGHRRRDGLGASPRCTTSPARPPSATHPPARSTWSSRRCTARTRSRSPTTCSPPSSGRSGCRPNTVKVGIMDEERRTTVNLAECIRAARSRVVFINTGFLDRTGDEIHTSMLAGPMVRKADMRVAAVDPGLRGLERRHRPGVRAARPGPDRQGHVGRRPTAWPTCSSRRSGTPRAGASCAWVPSPTAATLHATHYHRVDVGERQRELSGGAPRASLDDLLAIPLAVRRPSGPTTSAEPRSTTTCRASSATSCAGSTRASAARRCPTSTASR